MAKLDEIIIALARIEQRQDDLCKELLGNGQPGRIQRAEDAIEELHKHTRRLNRKVDIASGGAAMLAFIVGLLEGWFHWR